MRTGHVAFNGLTLLSAPDGALLLQLHRRVISAPRDELPDLREALDGAPTALAA